MDSEFGDPVYYKLHNELFFPEYDSDQSLTKEEKDVDYVLFVHSGKLEFCKFLVNLFKEDLNPNLDKDH